MTVVTSESSRTVRNADEFGKDLKKYIDAAIGVILVRTREPHRACDALYNLSIRDEARYIQWDVLRGLMHYRIDPGQAEAPAYGMIKPVLVQEAAGSEDFGVALRWMNDENNRDTTIYTAINVPANVLGASPVIQHIKNFVRKARDYPQRLILVAHESIELPPILEDDVKVIDFLVPSLAELRDNFDEFLAEQQDSVDFKLSEEARSIITQNAVGMTESEFEDAISVAFIDAGDTDEPAETLSDPHHYTEILLKQKTEIIKKSNVLELETAVSMDNVGGFDKLKEWLNERINSYSDEARKYGIEAPKGILCVGPPGGGKSLFAKAVASVFNFPLVRFNIGNAFGRYVGDSESNMRSALKMVDAMAPCVLFIDEVDKGFAGSGGGTDGGTSDRVLGTFLTWMQDRMENRSKSPVFVVMTANNVTNLPPELMRKGRIDEIFACTFPSDKEREDILRIHFKKRGHNITTPALRKIAERTRNFVGSELENIVKDGLIRLFNRDPKSKIEQNIDIFVDIANSVKPLFTTFHEKVKAMNEWAAANAVAASSGMKFDNEEEQPAKPLGRTLKLRKGGGPLKGTRALDN